MPKTIKRRIEGPSNDFIYVIQNLDGRKDIVEAVLEIMDDDGPKPMLNMTASRKRPNCADQFHHDHQSGYEAWERSGDDPVGRVRDHNSAYPKLIDELDRRKSIRNIHVKTKAKGEFDPVTSKHEITSQRNPSKSDTSSRNPDSDNTSISSFHSFMSKDHEPMVS